MVGSAKRRPLGMPCAPDSAPKKCPWGRPSGRPVLRSKPLTTVIFDFIFSSGASCTLNVVSGPVWRGVGAKLLGRKPLPMK